MMTDPNVLTAGFSDLKELMKRIEDKQRDFTFNKFDTSTTQTNQLPCAMVGRTNQLPCAMEGRTNQLPCAMEGRTNQLPCAMEGRTNQLPCAMVGRTNQLPCAMEGRANQLPCAMEGRTNQLPCAMEDRNDVFKNEEDHLLSSQNAHKKPPFHTPNKIDREHISELRDILKTSLSSTNRGFENYESDELTDHELLTISVRGLNEILRNTSYEFKSNIKHRRRVLKNRLYAQKCRNKRECVQKQYYKENEALHAKLVSVRQERDVYKNKYEKLESAIRKAKTEYERGKVTTWNIC